MKNSIAEQEFYHPFIDGLRGIAILLVVLVHTSQSVRLGDPGHMSVGLDLFLSQTPRGVQLFFILSAFTLFCSSKKRFVREDHPTLNFFIRRAFRILPFWFVMTLFYGLRQHAPFVQIAANFFFLFGFFTFKEGFFTTPGGWSLFVEETFYVFLPFIFTHVRNLKTSIGLLVGTLGLCFAWGWWAPFPPAQWFCFAFGIVAFYLLSWKPFQNLQSHSFAPPALDLFALASLGFMFCADYRAAALSLFFLVIASSVKKGLFGRLTRTWLLRQFGARCYSIYLFHFALINFLSHRRDRFMSVTGLVSCPLWERILAGFLVVSAASFCVSFFTFNFFEKPCVNLGKKVIELLARRRDRWVVLGKGSL
jgi:peptidoglycan/LPS O-acetylase OafA/YrhL